MELGRSCSYPCVLQYLQVSSKSDEKQKKIINSPFFCLEFQSVSRIVKIEHSAKAYLSGEFKIPKLNLGYYWSDET